MSSTLTISLDQELLNMAEQEARSHDTTLHAVIVEHLRVMACNWRASQEGKTPITDSLRGVVKASSDLDENGILTQELMRRHGVQC